ncbi:MAG: hypothetical protein PUF30_07765 [bacterium]|nr:hypothetical protein [bacterium]
MDEIVSSLTSEVDPAGTRVSSTELPPLSSRKRKAEKAKSERRESEGTPGEPSACFDPASAAENDIRTSGVIPPYPPVSSK